MFTAKLDEIRVCVCGSECRCVCVQVYGNDTEVRPEFFLYERTQIEWRQHWLPM